MKKSLAFFALVITIICSLSLNVAAAGTCEFLGMDRETRGDWVGKYGGDGYIILANDPTDKLPGYAKLEHLDPYGDEASFWTWWDGRGDYDEDNPDIIARAPGALFYDETKTDRVAACYYNNNDPDHYLVIDIGSETKYISIYSLDYDENPRASTITVRDEKDKVLAGPIELRDYELGVYLKFKASGKIILEYLKDEGGNAVYSGIFFDKIEEPVVVEEVAVATPVVEVPVQAAPAPVAVAPVVAASAPRTGDCAFALYIALILLSTGAFVISRKRVSR